MKITIFLQLHAIGAKKSDIERDNLDTVFRTSFNVSRGTFTGKNLKRIIYFVGSLWKKFGAGFSVRHSTCPEFFLEEKIVCYFLGNSILTRITFRSQLFQKSSFFFSKLKQKKFKLRAISCRQGCQNWVVVGFPTKQFRTCSQSAPGVVCFPAVRRPCWEKFI